MVTMGTNKTEKKSLVNKAELTQGENAATFTTWYFNQIRDVFFLSESHL